MNKQAIAAMTTVRMRDLAARLEVTGLRMGEASILRLIMIDWERSH
ncbi:hypothetical protein [Actinophytocola sediminis]